MAGGKWTFCDVVRRRKIIQPHQLEAGNLKRCLSLWDVTALGVGSTLGAGVYVIIGYAAFNYAGPSIVLSFLIAGVAALFSGLCYAEFGARVPRAGSAYVYSYVAIGEVVAFFIGWCNILEAAMGAASLARGLSMYVDGMCNNSILEWATATMPISSSFLSPYFDLLAFSFVLVIGVLLSVGGRESSAVNIAFVLLNLFVIILVVIVGAINADSANWSIPSTDVPQGSGSGGFFPYGVWGTLKGAAICFYGFVGFDTINAAAEEVRKPQETIPMVILIVLLTAFVCYCGISIVLTMMVPYYLQNSTDAIGSAFVFIGWEWMKWVVFVGAFAGILASLFGALLPLPRLLYAMSSDGLLVSWFSKLTSSRKSPVFATISSAAVVAILAGILELEQLILMLCIGTLLSYTVVAVCVIVLRFRSEYAPQSSPEFFKEVFGCGFRLATRSTARIVYAVLFLFISVCVSMALILAHVERPLIPLLVLHVLALMLVIIMSLQPKAKEEVAFKTPLVPLIPCLSIYVNVHLMALIKLQTWIRVLIWLAIGIPVYLLGLCCFKKKDKEEKDIVMPHSDENGKPLPVQIVVESPTPPDSINRIGSHGDNTILEENEQSSDQIRNVRNETFNIEEIKHQVIIENNEEKEAKIIDLLDQVLQAEEETYGEAISLKDQNIEEAPDVKEVIHRKSLGELSDAGSDVSSGNQVLSKYDVIAQVHREDLPKVTEEEEEKRDDDDDLEQETEQHEQITAFNDSETNSRTDESGYSDTLDRNPFSESLEEKEDRDEEEAPNIPVPPPLDENFFRSPNFKKSYTISSRPLKKEMSEEAEEIPRQSVQSNNSHSDDNITFGSDRQKHFMSKLNDIFQNKITNNQDDDDEEPRKRSQSTGNAPEDNTFTVSRPSIFLDLKKEIVSREVAQNLRPVNPDETKTEEESTEEDKQLTRADLKSKLENIFAAGGPQLLKPRLMKSNPPTPEEAYQTDTSSTESIAKLAKLDKNDTLKRQKAKFGEVLNSFRLSFNKDDAV